MQKTHCWLEKRSLRRGRDKRIFGKIREERWLELEINRRTGAINPPLEGSQVSPVLTASIDQVLMQIKDEGDLTFPGKLKGDPSKRPKDKYCRFHYNHDHDTSDCYDLEQQIGALIRQGKLQRFVSKERTDPPPE